MKNRAERRLGAWGEALAANLLYRQGWKILDHHCCYRQGELDLVAEQGDTLAFVEVKLRTGDFITGAEAVTKRKQQRNRDAALRYLAEHPELNERYIRFDVCQITAPLGTDDPAPKIEYYENAYY